MTFLEGSNQLFTVSMVVFSLPCCFFSDARLLWLLDSLLWFHLCVLFFFTLLLRSCIGKCLKSSPVLCGHIFQRGALVLIPQVVPFHLICFIALHVWWYSPPHPRRFLYLTEECQYLSSTHSWNGSDGTWIHVWIFQAQIKKKEERNRLGGLKLWAAS